MVKVSIEVYSETARFAVAVQAKSIQRVLSIARVKSPIDPEGFSSSIPRVWAAEAKAPGRARMD